MTPVDVPRLLFASREARLADMDALPLRLRTSSLTHASAGLEVRLAGLRRLLDGLLAGRLASAGDWPWPPPALATALAAALDTLALPEFCRGNEELAETVLMGLLFHTDFIPGYLDRGVPEARAIEFAVDAFAADWQQRCGDMKSLVEVFGDLGDLPKNARWDRLRGLLRSDGWQEVVRIRQLLERLPELARIIRSLGRARVTDVPDSAGQ
ncbi:MAG: VWA domain-containing protein, partial [Rhodocyclaceae bacterium]|nr:VWA domain-containing protein [Rhodocyclaceae bacterium]